MKKLYTVCVFLFCASAIHAQKVKLGIKGKKNDGELLATDPIFPNNKNHFKNIPFTLKAGQGVVFYMQTMAFSPYLILLSNDGKYFGTQRIKEAENGKETRVSFFAMKKLYDDANIFIPADTAFRVLFTSVEENATGKYSFGYKLLDSAQMEYSEDYSFCDRLHYLINQWQVDWDLIPESAFNPITRPGKITKYTLMPDKTGSSLATGTGVVGASGMDEKASYYETMFSSSTDKGGTFYGKIISDIQKCLGETNWVFETEESQDNIRNHKRDISYFYMKGAAKDQPHASFKVIWNVPLKPDALFQYEVQLIFN